jgi:hypothetical protein
MTNIRKVVAGEPLKIPAEVFNQFVDAANFVNNQKRSGTAEAKRGYDGTVLIKNNTEEDRERYTVMKIDSPAIHPDDNEQGFLSAIIFNGEDIDADTAGRWAILQEPIPAGRVGKAIISGHSIARIIINSSDDDTCGAVDGEGLLHSGVTGNTTAAILWREDEPEGSGEGEPYEAWGIIKIGNEAYSLPLYITTSDEEDNTIKAKRIDIFEEPQGDEIIFDTFREPI